MRAQTRDVINTLHIISQAYTPSYYVLMEDDFEICAHGLRALEYIIDRNNRVNPDWLGARTSFGLNGVILQGKDMLPFANYLEKHSSLRPPDHLLVEWIAGEKPESKEYKQSRKHTAFKFNLFDHLGKVSTLRPAQAMAFPRCWDRLGEPILFEVEAFKEKECPFDNVWPCEVEEGGILEPPIVWKVDKAKEKV